MPPFGGYNIFLEERLVIFTQVPHGWISTRLPPEQSHIFKRLGEYIKILLALSCMGGYLVREMFIWESHHLASSILNVSKQLTYVF